MASESINPTRLNELFDREEGSAIYLSDIIGCLVADQKYQAWKKESGPTKTSYSRETSVYESLARGYLRELQLQGKIEIYTPDGEIYLKVRRVVNPIT